MIGTRLSSRQEHHARAIIIGGGMAGAACAWALSRHFEVVVLEAEPVPGYHATGRSAALYSEYFGDPLTRALTRGSRAFFHAPPPEICEPTLLRKRGTIALATAEDQASGAVDEALSAALGMDLPIRLIDLQEARRFCPALRPPGYVGAVYRQSTWDINVSGLHHGFLRAARARGATLHTRVRLEEISACTGGWRLRGEISSRPFELQAQVVINAAGAWADEVAQMAGIPPLGLKPKRRTIAYVELPADKYEPPAAGWPMINDLSDTFYFKPEGGGLIVSPCDSTVSAPCDARPEEIDVALALDYLERLTSLSFKRVSNRWAGLRTFSPDVMPVLGALPENPGFYWVTGLGGAGIQTAPAVGEAIASLVTSSELPGDLVELGLTVEAISPSRLRQRQDARDGARKGDRP